MNILFHIFLKKFIQVGTLQVVDVDGQKTTFTGTSGPLAAMQLHTKAIEWKLLSNADMALGEGYMDGDITFEGSNLYDFLDLCTLNLRLAQSSVVYKIIQKVRYPFRYFSQYNPRIFSKNRIPFQ